MILALIFASALTAADPAAGGGSATERSPVSAPLKPGERRVKMICRTESKPNSRVMVRACYDLADVEAREVEDQRMLREIQMKSPLN